MKKSKLLDLLLKHIEQGHVIVGMGGQSFFVANVLTKEGYTVLQVNTSQIRRELKGKK